MEYRMHYLLLFILIACSNVHQEIDKGKFYRRDIEINVNGRSGDGVLVVPSSAKYEIKIKAPGKLDLYTITSCHREETGHKDGIWKNKKMTYDYVPVPGIEDRGPCPVHLGAYEKTQGRHSWGLLDFEDPSATMPAKIKCNGEIYQANGVSICQSKEGLLQEIEFSEPMVADFDKACPQPKVIDNKVFQYAIGKGHCLHYFQEIRGSGRIHRQTTIGYESILIREF